MADITRRRQGEMVRALFEVLQTAEEVPSREAVEGAIRRLQLTEYELGHYESSPGSIRFDKILRFTTVTVSRAGWMFKSKSGWSITDAGREAYRRFTDPEEFMREAERGYRAWKRSQQPATTEAPEDEGELTAEAASVTLERAQEDAWAEIEAYLRTMPPYDFQKLVAALLKAMGFHVPWIAPPGKDGGTDIIAYTDPLGAQGPRIKVQVKRHNVGKITVSDLRSFLAVLGSQDVGIFVAINGFTTDAQQEARSQDSRRVMLLDLDELVDLWMEHYETVAETDRHLLPLQPVYFLSPS